MKYSFALNNCFLLACVGLNALSASSAAGSAKPTNVKVTENASIDLKINYSAQRRIKWPKAKSSDCSKYCTCYVSGVLCRNRQLKEVPLFKIKNLKTMTIQKTQIKSLRKEHFFQMFHLTDLQLNDNKLLHLQDRVFEDLIKLETLNLSRNNLSEINGLVFRHLVSLKELDLNHNNLKNIERGLGFLANLNTLLLSGNKIKSISNVTFYGNSNVRILDLSFNLIRSISSRGFSRMKNLALLMLNNNPLHRLDVHFDSNLLLEQLDITNCNLEGLFKESPRQLKDLRLSGNKLTSIMDEDFINSNAIQLLLLNDNRIENLSDTAFDHMPLLHDLYINKNRLTKLPSSMPSRLYNLYASHNSISSITWKPLAKKYNLRRLALSHNKISHIDPNAMRSLVYLVHLDLSHNDIKYLKAGMFGRTISLEKLDLSDNPLQLLEPGCFMGLKKLHILKVSSVPHRLDLEASAFEDLKNLLFLDISHSSLLAKQLLTAPSHGKHLTSLRNLNIIGTGLRQLSHKLKRNLQNLTTVRMTNNPWHCSKKLLWIREWIRTSAIDFYEPENLVCRSPPRLKGRRLIDLTVYDVVIERYKQRKNNESREEDLFWKKLQILKRSLRKAFE